MKKILFTIFILFTLNVQAVDMSVLKDYSFNARDFKGTPEMLFNKGIIRFKAVDPSILNRSLNTSGWAADLEMLNILPLRYNPNNGGIEIFTWVNRVPAQRIFQDRAEDCNDPELINYCDFHFNRMFFDLINENEGIMYFRYIDEDRFAYFYFDEDLVLETRQEYLDRIMKENL